jgi:segregation and condensation protein A
MDFVVKHGEFEGPLDLLLQLVEKRKLFINDISLAGVTDDYLGHIGQLEVDIDQKTEFLVIAAILILLKSRSLLPNLELTEDEKGSVSDLEKRLVIFQIFNGAGEGLKNFIKRTLPLKLNKKRKVIKPIVFVPDQAISLQALHTEINEILNKQPKREVLPKISIQKVLTLEEVIDSLQERIQSATKFMFSSFTTHTNSKTNATTKEARVNIIVSFLAMLELVRQGILSVAQNENFDDIEIEKLGENPNVADELSELSPQINT